jgi:TATA-binding protein-associated factor Taf7
MKVPKPLKIAKKSIRKIHNRKVAQYKAPSGLTPPTKYIRKRFYRKEFQ